MSHPTDERVGHRMVFALAQVPYSHQNGQLIASLAPLMDLETGDSFDSIKKSFPADGYVFCGAVQRSDLTPGDLVIGTLRKASPSSYESSDLSWYQVSMEADSPHGEVFEYVKTSLPDDAGLRRLVDGRKMIDTSHAPPKLFFVWVNEQLVGPFHPQSLEHFQSPTGYCCEPTDRVGNIVRVASGRRLAEYVNNEIGYCEVALSSTNQHPAKNSTGRFLRRYRLIRRVDIASYSETTEELVVPTDEFAISKACRLIEGRPAKREAKSTLNSLVEKLRVEERQVGSGIAEAIGEIARRVNFTESVADKIAISLSASEAVQLRLEAAIRKREEDAIAGKSEFIESQAQERSQETLAELDALQDEVAKLEKSREEKWIELEEYSSQIEAEEKRLTSVVEAANQRLTRGRSELLGDISLLAPLFSSAAIPSLNGHGSVASRFGSNGAVPHRDSPPSETKPLIGAPLSEGEFLASRLFPLLLAHGIHIAENKSADLHALFIASKMLFLPDVSWAVAYADSMGGSAISACVTVEPDWMSFSKCYDQEFGKALDDAVADPSRLHILVLDGVDRSPSHAWLQPMFQVVAGWRKTFPDSSAQCWPENLRVVFTTERSEACFAIPQTFERWVVPFEVESDQSQEERKITEGNFPYEAWLLKDSASDDDFALEALFKELESEPSPLHFPVRQKLIRRLRDVYVRLGREEDRVLGPIKWILRPIELAEREVE